MVRFEKESLRSHKKEALTDKENHSKARLYQKMYLDLRMLEFDSPKLLHDQIAKMPGSHSTKT